MKAKKRKEKLKRRQEDYDNMVGSNKLTTYRGFHRPGSTKK